ncbi:MAG: hypothetical protein WBV06_04120 [Acidimicrobiia bacterium]
MIDPPQVLFQKCGDYWNGGSPPGVVFQLIGARGVTEWNPDEAAFESHIAEWLAAHDGYTAWKVGTRSDDFDAARGLDTAELFTYAESLFGRPKPPHNFSVLAPAGSVVRLRCRRLGSRGHALTM